MEPGTRRLRPIVWGGVCLSAFQQLVGINVIFYYGAVLWEAAWAHGEQRLCAVRSAHAPPRRAEHGVSQHVLICVTTRDAG